MTQILVQILWGIAGKLLTQGFVSKMLIQGLRYWAESTENNYDDAVVIAMAEALGVDDVKLKIFMQENEK